MLVYELKLKGKQHQYDLLDEAIRTGQFIQNACLRLWMDAKPEDKINRFALNKYCKVLADNPEFPWAKKLNSMARQAHAERTWAAMGAVLLPDGTVEFVDYNPAEVYRDMYAAAGCSGR